MRTSHIRYLLFIFGAQIILSTTVVTSVKAQSARANYNYMDFERKPYYFGITLGFNRADYRVFRSSDFITSDSIDVIESVRGPGFNLGIVSNLKIGDYFDLRLLPTLSFAERNFQFEPTKAVGDRNQYVAKVESVFVELPFQVRYKSVPYYDKRLFVLAGIKYGFDVAADSRGRQANKLVKVSATDFALEYGFGLQMYFPYFIFSPEFKISNGLVNNLIYKPDTQESRIIEKILTRNFTVSLHFEG